MKISQLNSNSLSKTLEEDDIISPIPENIKFDFHHFELGKPDKYFAYKDTKGRVIGYIARWEKNGKKEIRPVCYTNKGWRCKGFKKPWIFYNSHLIEKHKELPIIICEG